MGTKASQVHTPWWTIIGIELTCAILVTLILAAMHRAGTVTIGWAWVLAPLWLPAVVAVALYGAVMFLGILAVAISMRDAQGKSYVRKDKMP